MSRRSCRSRSLTLLWLVPLLAATACQAPDGAIAVTLASPSSTAYTSDTVTIQVSVNGEVDAVELYRDGAPLVELAPPYTYTWDTRAEPEGAYEIAALARRGTQTSSSEPVTVVVDRTPPHVAARDPAPNQDHVAVDASIIVDVTEPLAPSSVSSASVRLEAIGQGPLDVDVTLSEDGHRLTIVPDPLPEPPAELELELTDAITDRAGNALSAPAPWSWSVPVWRRLGGYLNVDANIAARTPRVAMDAEERPLVIWLEDLPDSKAPADLYVKRWDGEAWTQFAHRAVVVRNVFRMDGAGQRRRTAGPGRHLRRRRDRPRRPPPHRLAREVR